MTPMEITIGLCALFTLVGARYVAVRLRMSKFYSCWDDANTALARKDYASAESAFRTCVKLYPLAVEPRHGLSVALAETGRFKEAEDELKLAANLRPRLPEGYVNLGYFYLRWGNNHSDAALAAFEKAIDLSPELRDRLAGDPVLAPLRDRDDYRRIFG